MYDNIILIPYRQRQKHLEYFVEHTVPLLQKHLPNSKVVVIEQGNTKPFNRGKVLNVGFKEYQNGTKYFITHDVDINPTKDIVAKCYGIECSIYTLRTPHKESLGGITKLSSKAVHKMNGYPNNIWGWGIEDRALFHRARIKNIKIIPSGIPSHTFKAIRHASNAVYDKPKLSKVWTYAHIKTLSDEEKEQLILESGLNNLEYTIQERKNISDYVELIKVDI